MQKICHNLVLNKQWTKYIHIEKIYIWYCIFNSTLTNTYDQSMLDVLGLYFTFNSFLHIEQKIIKYGISPMIALRFS